MRQQKVWDDISESWHNFRQRPVQEAIFYSNHWKPDKILDIGCGNCRNLLPFAQQGFQCYGIDFSREMLEKAHLYAKKHNFKVKLRQAHMEHLPFKENTFDYCISIASFHHIETKQKRKKSLQEMRRVLKRDGYLLLAVWNKLQWRFLFSKKDSFITWHVKRKSYQRYNHLFTYLELKKLVQEAGFQIIKSNIFGRNLIFLLKNQKP
ncbi:class I SAM-dependent methyltransferase [Candidatus Woesearchaeota archaeon]|nr:class I SAM-dependent methyltransferase [Candidatus Woesearchaeota archaeon]